MFIETAAELHDANLDLLRKFDRFCSENGVKYFITFGTLLGAVRHGGMIPWDDDIDVTMLRSEYYKLIKISKQKYPEGCELLTPGEDKTFCGFTPMFKDNSYVGKMIKGSDSDDGSGTGRIGIDIFVLDPSYTGPRHTILTYRLYLLYAQARAHRAIHKPVDTNKPKILVVPVVKFFEFIGKRRKLYRIVEDYWNLSLDLKSKGRVLYSPCNIPKRSTRSRRPRKTLLRLNSTSLPWSPLTRGTECPPFALTWMQNPLVLSMVSRITCPTVARRCLMRWASR